jgi:branched-chain amino acid transport system ATP-binding protein
METILKVDDINVYYGSIHAIKGVSFDVAQGEIVTLIGANGAGKSTTLNTISGLLHSKTGSVTFLGESLNRVPPHKIVSKGLALVPEGRRVFLQMTTQENLEMGAYTQPGGHVAEDLDRGVPAVPPAEGTAAADRRHPLRRGAADAGHGPRSDEPSQAADAG